MGQVCRLKGEGRLGISNTRTRTSRRMLARIRSDRRSSLVKARSIGVFVVPLAL